MNYDVYEVELETGIKGFRLLQHVKATDMADAQAKVEAIQQAPAIRVDFRRPCTEKEIALAVADGIVPQGTLATATYDDGAPILEVKP